MIDLMWDPIRNDPGFRRSNVTPTLAKLARQAVRLTTTGEKRSVAPTCPALPKPFLNESRAVQI